MSVISIIVIIFPESTLLFPRILEKSFTKICSFPQQKSWALADEAKLVVVGGNKEGDSNTEMFTEE